MKLTPRLQAVASFVLPCALLADVGTDHAYIPIELVSRRIARKAVASDISAGPLSIARGNIACHGLSDRIDTVLCAGLDGVSGADAIVIAGMGGEMICNILGANPQKARLARQLVLQPMTDVELVRRFLFENDFSIVNETLAKEEEKLYNILDVIPVKEMDEPDEVSFCVGRRLLENSDPLLCEYLSKQIRSLDTAILNMSRASAGMENKRERFSRRRRLFLEVYHDYCANGS